MGKNARGHVLFPVPALCLMQTNAKTNKKRYKQMAKSKSETYKVKKRDFSYQFHK